ncbi:MAG: DEAD/DEAH box helicase family protein, partial [Rubrobacteraceae bacterium]
MGRRRKAGLRFDQCLVLNQWMLGLFGVESFEALADEEIKDPRYEERDANNVSGILHLLAGRFHDLPERTGGPSTDDLLRYDENIVRHTDRISEKREARVRWKYFQYLSLLFAEIYLDRYFRDPEALLEALNAHVRRFNAGEDEADRVPDYVPGDLRKLAFWMATGSGKTLIMHVNVLQYLHYLRLHGRRDELDRILLLTPNEGLSRQHLKEFGESGLDAELFSKSGQGRFTDDRIEVLEVTKLADDSGATTVAVEAFEGNNLVLVDEGHRGMSSARTVRETKKWKERRDRLCEGGFSFEYSATFGQAMKSAKDKGLSDEYAKCVLFDYSYRFFYGDGYGKDYQILNLQDNDGEAVRRRYLTAALLSFH